MYFFDGFTQAEIAKRTGELRSFIGNRLGAIRKKIFAATGKYPKRFVEADSRHVRNIAPTFAPLVADETGGYGNDWDDGAAIEQENIAV